MSRLTTNALILLLLTSLGCKADRSQHEMSTVYGFEDVSLG